MPQDVPLGFPSSLRSPAWVSRVYYYGFASFFFIVLLDFLVFFFCILDFQLFNYLHMLGRFSLLLCNGEPYVLAISREELGYLMFWSK